MLHPERHLFLTAMTGGALCALVCSGACSPKPAVLYDAGPPHDGGGGDAQDAPDGSGDGGSDGGGGQAACNPAATFGAPAAVPGVPAGDKALGTITHDELTIAWVEPNGTVKYADRTDASQPFGAAQALPGTFANDAVGLSGDGLTMVLALAGNASLGQVTRASRAVAFGAAVDTAPFSKLLTGMGSEDGGTSTGNIGDPVLAADGKQMFFSVWNKGDRDTVAVSDLFGASWSLPTILVDPLFQDQGGLRRHPTGLSKDGRTLFFWDETDNKEKAVWRATGTSFDTAFSGLVDYGDKKGARPNAACDRIYFTAPVTAPSDVKLANKM